MRMRMRERVKELKKINSVPRVTRSVSKGKSFNYLLIQKKECKMPFNIYTYTYIRRKKKFSYKQTNFFVFVFNLFPQNRSKDIQYWRLFQLPSFDRKPKEDE